MNSEIISKSEESYSIKLTYFVADSINSVIHYSNMYVKWPTFGFSPNLLMEPHWDPHFSGFEPYMAIKSLLRTRIFNAAWVISTQEKYNFWYSDRKVRCNWGKQDTFQVSTLFFRHSSFKEKVSLVCKVTHIWVLTTKNVYSYQHLSKWTLWGLKNKDTKRKVCQEPEYNKRHANFGGKCKKCHR